MLEQLSNLMTRADWQLNSQRGDLRTQGALATYNLFNLMYGRSRQQQCKSNLSQRHPLFSGSLLWGFTSVALCSHNIYLNGSQNDGWSTSSLPFYNPTYIHTHTHTWRANSWHNVVIISTSYMHRYIWAINIEQNVVILHTTWANWNRYPNPIKLCHSFSM